MIETKNIPEADMIIIRNMDKQLESLIKAHHKVRKDFLRAEAVLLREHGICERELKTFVVGLCRSLDIPEDDVQNWRLELSTGIFTKNSADPEPELIPEIPEEPIVEEPTFSKEELALQEIRKKYQR